MLALHPTKGSDLKLWPYDTVTRRGLKPLTAEIDFFMPNVTAPEKNLVSETLKMRSRILDHSVQSDFGFQNIS